MKAPIKSKNKHYTFEKRNVGHGYELWFTVGVQSFQIGPTCLEESEVDWFKKMFKKAIDNLLELNKMGESK